MNPCKEAGPMAVIHILDGASNTGSRLCNGCDRLFILTMSECERLDGFEWTVFDRGRKWGNWGGFEIVQILLKSLRLNRGEGTIFLRGSGNGRCRWLKPGQARGVGKRVGVCRRGSIDARVRVKRSERSWGADESHVEELVRLCFYFFIFELN